MGNSNFEAIGEWWDVENKNRKVSGKLTFSRESGGELETKGSLRSPDFGMEWESGKNGEMIGSYTRETEKKSRYYKRIVGSTKSDPVTLEECTRTRASGNFLEYKWEIIEPTWMLVGAHFKPGEKLEFDQFTVKLGNLTRWTAKSGLLELPIKTLKMMGRTIPPEKENVWYELRAIPVEAGSFTLKDGWEVKISHAVTKSGDGIHENKLTQEFSFSATHSHLRPIEEIFDLVSDLQDLITVSSKGASAIRELLLRRPDVVQGPKKQRKNIKFYARWNFPNPSSKDLNDEENSTYFTLSDLGGAEGAKKWIETASQHRLKVSRALSSRYFSGMITDDVIINAASALESFDKSIKNDNVQDLKVRLNRMQKLAGYPFSEMISDPEMWSDLLKKYRNESAHNLEKLIDSDFSRKYWISRSAYWLFVICMMRVAELPDSAFQVLGGNPNFMFEAGRIKEIDLT
ncbi:ApeA N-terminal domain 1-containing protein [Nocardiopsis protaetiae]